MRNQRSTRRPRVSRMAALISIGAMAAMGFATEMVALAPSASARVVVTSPDAKPGAESATLVFTVPNVSEKYGTIQIQIDLSHGTPFTQVRAQQLPGWSVRKTATPLPEPVRVDGRRIDQAVTAVNWIASGTGIRPGEFQEFRLSVGPLPKFGPLVLPVLQWYSNHTTVQWGQIVRPDGDQPRHPAPVLQIGSIKAPAPAPVAAPSASPSSAADSADHADLAKVLAGIGLALSLVVVAVVVVTRLRTKSVRPGHDSA